MPQRIEEREDTGESVDTSRHENALAKFPLHPIPFQSYSCCKILSEFFIHACCDHTTKSFPLALSWAWRKIKLQFSVSSVSVAQHLSRNSLP